MFQKFLKLTDIDFRYICIFFSAVQIKRSTCKIFSMEKLPVKKKIPPQEKQKYRIHENDEYSKPMSRNSILKTITQAKLICTTSASCYIALTLSFLN